MGCVGHNLLVSLYIEIELSQSGHSLCKRKSWISLSNWKFQNSGIKQKINSRFPDLIFLKVCILIVWPQEKFTEGQDAHEAGS